MALFKVEEVINGNTIRVTGWQWGQYAGKLVKIQGYSIPDKPVYQSYVKNKLKTLLDGKSVDLKQVIHAEKSPVGGEDVISCSVFLNEINIATYFRELELENI